MSRDSRVLEFTLDDRGAVVDLMRELAARHHGWVNVQPLVEPDQLPAPTGGIVLGWITGGLPPLPIGTWIAPQVRRGQVRPASLGLAHNANAKVARRLVAAGLAAPPGWKMVQDNARRGLVCEIPADAEVAGVLDWLLRAMVELSSIPTVVDYRATVHS